MLKIGNFGTKNSGARAEALNPTRFCMFDSLLHITSIRKTLLPTVLKYFIKNRLWKITLTKHFSTGQYQKMLLYLFLSLKKHRDNLDRLALQVSLKRCDPVIERCLFSQEWINSFAFVLWRVNLDIVQLEIYRVCVWVKSGAIFLLIFFIIFLLNCLSRSFYVDIFFFISNLSS